VIPRNADLLAQGDGLRQRRVIRPLGGSAESMSVSRCASLERSGSSTRSSRNGCRGR